jgi:acyl carrier protein
VTATVDGSGVGAVPEGILRSAPREAEAGDGELSVTPSRRYHCEMPTRQEIYDAIREEIAAIWEETGEGELPDIAATDNFFDLGIVDSFGMMKVINKVEQMTGEPIDLMVVEPDVFFTLDGIAGYILGTDDAVPAGGGS